MFWQKHSHSSGNASIGKLATGLGLASYALGTTQLIRPGSVNRFIGVPDYNPNHALQRVLGAREIICGTGVLFSEHRRVWMWMRVAGDVMDATILTAMLVSGLGTRTRLIPAMGALAGITALDIMVAAQIRER